VTEGHDLAPVDGFDVGLGVWVAAGLADKVGVGVRVGVGVGVGVTVGAKVGVAVGVVEIEAVWPGVEVLGDKLEEGVALLVQPVSAIIKPKPSRTPNFLLDVLGTLFGNRNILPPFVDGEGSLLCFYVKLNRGF
jgi:hypothetical protein